MFTIVHQFSQDPPPLMMKNTVPSCMMKIVIRFIRCYICRLVRCSPTFAVNNMASTTKQLAMDATSDELITGLMAVRPELQKASAQQWQSGGLHSPGELPQPVRRIGREDHVQHA